MNERERFEKFTKEFVFPHEGTIFENDPNDPGGPTKYGIDHRSHPDVDIKNLTEAQALEIYWTYYWTANTCGAFPGGLGESHYDCCINCGAKRAGRILAASNGDALKYNNERAAFYARLVAARPSAQRYLKGWLRRVQDLREYLKL